MRPISRVVVAEHVEQLLRLGRLGEGGEAAQVAEDGRDDPPVTAQERLAVGARDQLGDLGREEAGQLGALAVDGPQVVALEVAQALGGQRGREAGLEDGGVERLGQVVGGAHLDAADDAVELVDGRDDDDRQVGDRLGGLDPAERLVAVHLGHLEVEQDDVDARRALRLEQVHRLPAVLGLDDLVALRLEGAGEDGPVEPGVVDDEDAPALVAHAASPASRPRAGRPRPAA